MTDITEVLRNRRNKNAVLFNPSIAWISGNDYLVSVRGWDAGENESLDQNPDFGNNISHPWFYGWKYDEEKGSDECYLSIIEIKIDQKQRNYQVKKKQDLPIEIKGEDARVFRVNRNRYYITYNVIVEDDPNVVLKGGTTCGDDRCVVVEMIELTLRKSLGKYTFSIKRMDAGLCWNLSETFEKNWSVWRLKNRNYMLYKLVPLEVFDFSDQDITGGCFSAVVSTSPNFLEKLQKYYGNYITASLSTPAYEFPKDSGTYLTLGHMKCRYQSYEYKRFANKNLAKFVSNSVDEDFIHPGGLLYFIYWIEFIPRLNKKKELEISITRISNSFLVEGHQPYSLDFASGFAYNTTLELLWVSYGEADGIAKLVPFTPKLVNDCLMDYNTITPKNYEFGTLRFPFQDNRCELIT